MLKKRIICLCFFSLLLVIPTQIVTATTNVANSMEEDETISETLTKNEKVESKATIGFSTRVENSSPVDLDKPISKLPITGENLESSISNLGLLLVVSYFVYMYIKKKKKNKGSN